MRGEEQIAEFNVKFLDLGRYNGKYVYYASAQDIEGCFTEGKGRTKKEALRETRRMIRDAIVSISQALPHTVLTVGEHPSTITLRRRQGDEGITRIEAERTAPEKLRGRTPVIELDEVNPNDNRMVNGFTEVMRIPVSELKPKEQHKHPTPLRSRA